MVKRFVAFLFLLSCITVYSQPKQVPPAPETKVAGVETVTSHSSVTVGGKKIDYTAYTGYLDLRNDTGKLIAKMFFVYYKKDGDDAGKRPITFTFNGGPGSSSVWLHMGAIGPRRVLLKDDGTAPNPHTR